MKNTEYLIITHSAKQRELIFDAIFSAGLIWQSGYQPVDRFTSGNQLEGLYPFQENVWDAIVLHDNGYVAMGTNYSAYSYSIKLDANTNFIDIIDLISKVARNFKPPFKPIEVPMNPRCSATIINRCGRVMIGQQEFEASMILNLAKEIQKVINS
jgi:hypothetical protein